MNFVLAMPALSLGLLWCCGLLARPLLRLARFGEVERRYAVGIPCFANHSAKELLGNRQAEILGRLGVVILARLQCEIEHLAVVHDPGMVNGVNPGKAKALVVLRPRMVHHEHLSVVKALLDSRPLSSGPCL